jgi:type I restriction enzyme, R subunit
MLKQKNEQVIDNVTQDAVLEAGFSEAARERAQKIVTSFEQFIQQHKDEITALQILYNRPTKAPLKYEDLKSLAEALHMPPHLIDESQLWQAYAALDKSKVKGTSAKRILTDLVSLVRYAMHQENDLVPYPERVAANFKVWLAQQQAVGKQFTPGQRKWLEMIRDHIAANLGIEIEDFEYVPFNKEGGIGKVHRLFGAELPKVIGAMNTALVA